MDGDNLNIASDHGGDITHWKKLAAHYKEKFQQVEQDFEDFQENSQLLERELEATLEQSEKRERDQSTQNSKLQNELEKSRVNLSQADSRIGDLESKVAEYRSQEEKLIKYIRDLEQKNDDLERSQRALAMSLGENEAKLNSAIERNAFLESEQDEAGAMVQRLKDETRDLREEMKVRVLPDNDKSLRSNGLVDSNKMDITPNGSTPASPLIMGSNGNLPLTAPTRISAVNMVSDLLRKVGALESKLASCRNASRDSPLPDTPTNRDPLYRARRLSRGGTTSPSIHGYLRA